jgi:signal transduction histidine kinase
MDAPHLAPLRERSELEKVQSFVAIPVRVGTGIFGVLSFAASCEYEYSPVEWRGFESIANGIGVAITNYRHFNDATNDLARHSEIAVAITAIEIAQAARHEARGILDDCQHQIAIVKSSSNKKVADVDDDLSKVSGDLRKIHEALQKIKSASKPPVKELARVSLKRTWDEARSLVLGRLGDLGISAFYEGPDIEIEMYSDWFRQVYVNLLLNSIDAYRERSGKRGRRINLRVESPAERAQVVSMRYTDNATGIEPTDLLIPDKLKGVAIEQVIF